MVMDREQTQPKNKAPPKSPLGSSSRPFQLVQKTMFVEAGGCSSSPLPQSRHENMVEIPPIGDVSSSVIPQMEPETHVEKPNMGLHFDQDVPNPKRLKRILSNRKFAQRSRVKKVTYLASLENEAKIYEDQIAKLEPQLANYENERRYLMLEQQTLDHEVAALHQETLLREAEIEKDKAEVNMLRELRAKQQEQMQMQAQMPTWNTSLLDQPVYNAPCQVPGNGMESSYMQVPQEQSQMWMPTVPNMYETNNFAMPNMYEVNNMAMPNYMGSMEANFMDNTLPNPNFNHHFTY